MEKLKMIQTLVQNKKNFQNSNKKKLYKKSKPKKKKPRKPNTPL